MFQGFKVLLHETKHGNTTTASAGRELVAMFGRSGNELDQVGFYLRKRPVALSASHEESQRSAPYAGFLIRLHASRP